MTARGRFKFDGDIFGRLDRKERVFSGGLKIFEFFQCFAFPFLEDVVVFAWDFRYFIEGSFTFELSGVERFGMIGMIVDGRITDGKDGLISIGRVSCFFDGLFNEEIEHGGSVHNYFYLLNKFDYIVDYEWVLLYMSTIILNIYTKIYDLSQKNIIPFID